MNRPAYGQDDLPAAKSFVVIPARLASTRLPRKLLLRETGKTVLQHTYEQAKQARLPLGVCVATDHDEIAREVRSFGGKAVLTNPAHPSGTDRVAEIALHMPDVGILVNVQGDEPEIDPTAIDQLITLLLRDPDAELATLAVPIRDPERLFDPNCVKVTFDRTGRAMYFSRSPIPCMRDRDDTLLAQEPPRFFQHVGIYAYRRDYLLKITSMPPSALEQIEKLEQLRVLEQGGKIVVGTIGRATRGIDTPEDYRDFVRRRGACAPSAAAA